MSTIRLLFGDTPTWKMALRIVQSLFKCPKSTCQQPFGDTPFWNFTFWILKNLEYFPKSTCQLPKASYHFPKSESREEKKGLMKKTQKTQCQPFNCLLATHPFEIWHSRFSRVCRISQSQLVNCHLPTPPLQLTLPTISSILNIFQSQLVNAQKRHTISQNQSLQKKKD